MLCQNCQKNVAKIHVTELQASASDEKAPGTQPFQEQHLCEVCAESMDLPSMPSAKKTTQEI